jgi:hypothetical protein
VYRTVREVKTRTREETTNETGSVRALEKLRRREETE